MGLRGNKKGSEKYYIIISLILGIMILALALYFIFHEYFTEDELGIEQCRQSIVLANLNPDLTERTGTDFKDKFPLKCKTRVVEIDTTEKEEIYKIISDTILSCWYMYGEERFDAVHTEFWGNKNYALVCARITFSNEAIESFEENRELVPIGGDWETASGFAYSAGEEEYISGFYDYYIKTKAPNSKKTYDELLPLFGADEVGKGYVFLSTNNFYPQESDLFVVYTKVKMLGLAKAWFTSPTTWIANQIAPLFGREPLTDENIKKYETPHMNLFNFETFEQYSEITDENKQPLEVLTIPA